MDNTLNTSHTICENLGRPSSTAAANINTTSKSQNNHRSRSIDQEGIRVPQASARSNSRGNPTIALSFANKELASIPKTVIEHMANLLILDLSNNKFKEFPQDIFSLSKLKCLKLDSNRIKVLPPEVTHLPCLENLSIASNYLKAIPDNICLLSKTLTLLNISCNEIENLPDSICDLVNLRVLHIQNNAFTSLPKHFDELSSLRELNFEWFKYTVPPLNSLQNDTSRETITNLFQGIKKLRTHQKSQVMTFGIFLRCLSEQDDDLFTRKDPLERNLVHIAALEEEVGVIKFLAVEKPELLNEIDQNQQTPLLLAVREEKDKAARALIQCGANPSIGSGPLGSPLHIAIVRHKLDLVKELLKAKAGINDIDPEGNTPIHILCNIFSKSVAACREIGFRLVEAGADPNKHNYDGWAPIHLAIRRGQTECVKWIVEVNHKNSNNGKRTFDVNVTGGSDKWTPLHLAAGLGYYEILHILVDNNAELMAKTKTGKSPREVAVNNVLICKVLKKLEDDWIHTKLFSTKMSLGHQLQEFASASNVMNLKHMIHSGSAKMIESAKEQTGRDYPRDNARDHGRDHAREHGGREHARINDERKPTVPHNLKTRPASSTAKLKEKMKPVRAFLRIEDFNTNDESSNRIEDSTNIGDVDEIVQTKETARVIPRSPNNIQKIQITQNYREHMLRMSLGRDSLPGKLGAGPLSVKNKPNSSSALTSGLNSVRNRDSSQYIPSSQSSNTFVFPSNFHKYITNFESYVEEIKTFQELLLKEVEVPLSEKLKHVFYMQVLHMKINRVVGKMTSEQMPIELFILCEHIEDELRKAKDQQKKMNIAHNYDIIPRTLLFVFENLDSRKLNKNSVVKARISQLFGDFKYESSKHFLQQLLQTPRETRYLRSQAKIALKFLSKETGLVPKLRTDNMFNDKSLASVLVSPKQDHFQFPNGGTKPSQQRQVEAEGVKPPSSVGGKANKRTLSYAGLSLKCENIDDEDDHQGVGRQHDLRVSLDKTPNLVRRAESESRRNSLGVRAMQGPLPSKLEMPSSRTGTEKTQITLENDDYNGMEIRGIPRKVKAKNYFSQV